MSASASLSLSEGFGRAARLGLPEDLYAADLGTGSAFDSSPDITSGILDALVSRVMPLDTDPHQETSTQNAAQRAHDNLQQAWTNARTLQRDTVKLNDQQMTTASGQGVRRTGEQIQNKAAAAQELTKAAAQMRREGQIVKNETAAPQGGSGMAGKLAKDAAVGAFAGAAAEAALPGSGALVSIIGAGTMGVKTASSFKSAADDAGSGAGYSSAAGHQTVDVMGGAPVTTGAEFNAMMSRGPGFNHLPSVIEHEIEPGLDGMKVSFTEDQVAELELVAKQMTRDAGIGENMFKRHLEAQIAVTENTGNAPVEAFKAKPQDRVVTINPGVFV